jgi:hypothetical protein
MRLWSLHPRYLDPQGLVALWREGLLAQKVIQGKTAGYRNHPQLERFRAHPKPVAAIAFYLDAVLKESMRRGYSFNAAKIGDFDVVEQIPCTRGQVLFEIGHLKKKLEVRSPGQYHDLLCDQEIALHPLFFLKEGDVEPWERGAGITGLQQRRQRRWAHEIP